MRWEHREVELERTIGRLEYQAAEIAGAASKVSHDCSKIVVTVDCCVGHV